MELIKGKIKAGREGGETATVYITCGRTDGKGRKKEGRKLKEGREGRRKDGR